jgi:LysM repeat protein
MGGADGDALDQRRTLTSMNVRTTHRLAAVAGPVVVAALVLGACGGDDSGATTRATVTLAAGETDYQTIAPATTASLAPGEVPAGAEQEYTVQAGDYGIKVANQFGVSLEDLENANGWSDASTEFPGPGTVIKIPAGGTIAAADTPVDTPAAADETGGEEVATVTGGEAGEAIPDPGSNCEAGSHTVAAGDIPLKLVEQYDVTLEALEAANANNPAYRRFIPGEKIIIPAKEDC